MHASKEQQELITNLQAAGCSGSCIRTVPAPVTGRAGRRAAEAAGTAPVAAAGGSASG